VKVAIFGIVLQETLQTSRPGSEGGHSGSLRYRARLIPKIHAAGAQVIVALTHQTIGDDKKFARCSGVDVVIGGHEHTLLESMSGHAPIFRWTPTRANWAASISIISKFPRADWKASTGKLFP